MYCGGIRTELIIVMSSQTVQNSTKTPTKTHKLDRTGEFSLVFRRILVKKKLITRQFVLIFFKFKLTQFLSQKVMFYLTFDT